MNIKYSPITTMNGFTITAIGIIVVALGSMLSFYGQVVLRKADAEKAKAEAQSDAKGTRAELNTQLTRIEGKLGSDEATQRYLEAVGNLTRQLAAQKAGNAADRFFNSEPERRKVREELNQVSMKLLTAYKIRINPVAEYVISKLDNWMAEARKRGVNANVTSAEVP